MANCDLCTEEIWAPHFVVEVRSKDGHFFYCSRFCAVHGMLAAISKEIADKSGNLAGWAAELQKALPDSCEDWLPRSIRCPWCGTRFSGGYHEMDCPLRKMES